MKKIYLVLALTLMLALAIPAGATELLPPQLEYIDVQLMVFLPKVQSFQADYLAANGTYYQALGSHSVIPTGADGADRLEEHPTDQDATLAPLWEDTGLPTEIAWAFTITVYESPFGRGYLVTVCTDVEGVTWCLENDYGPGGGGYPWMPLPSGG